MASTPGATSDFTDSVAWGAQTDVTPGEVVEKQRLVRDIMASQDSLRALLARVSSVQADCQKAEADNEMLQMYIDSVTKSLAAKS
ncbi:hypothetical protein FA10DRAFT_284943 [Acaromyces ingoldii]|uniref:Uncharacterized protein n=1 Tax=Acaromyces ingoldii TaxID=215250 RepID=A0A316YRV6_9BASI|nr:hypothetical protein FA10DRAFT_284943 [Acaromyces ingoldii]PWN92039.1 hypothetical protein FA10DRAFT_284943 [Acaromyces ingoldii]